MELCIEDVKGLNLVDFLTRHYGLGFCRVGSEFACCSPFREEKTPSFFVRLVEGRWLFKDFSSGIGGSIFDFVQIKEGLGTFKEARDHILCLLSSGIASCSSDIFSPKEAESYDVHGLYERFGGKDVSACREYLLGRGISDDLICAMIDEGDLLYNRYKGSFLLLLCSQRRRR